MSVQIPIAKSLRQYLALNFQGAMIYDNPHGWHAIEKIGMLDLVAQKEVLESNPENEVIFGESPFETAFMSRICRDFFRSNNLAQLLFVSKHTPNDEPIEELVSVHRVCECHVFLMGDDNSETLCSITRMHESGLFVIVSRTTMAESDS